MRMKIKHSLSSSHSLALSLALFLPPSLSPCTSLHIIKHLETYSFKVFYNM